MIRPATPGDAAAIAAIWNPQIAESLVTFNSVPKPPDDIAAMIAARPVFLVAEDAGRVLGFATYDQLRGGVGYARTMEHTVILSPEGRGRGLGRALIGAIEAHATAAGVHSMFAGISGGNPDAVAFHNALGYQIVATLPDVGYKFDRYWDLILMQKVL